ncbi:energy-coupling factor transport system ATP-binding protein [Evansella caseinilytica]|uniref:Energy-coupling factor transport system ATP-binding protein n=1 Tax=Evansella caseinilytica TaxID=1503961 RepID=A0A1H3IEI7_9BACI|nr:ABC transporter ATP-binding protein [Evansella caseinilytica]SDY26017.1 energy-coupling factor transport system ATP-binding protein [Evansella caseinilytica]
MTEQIRLEHVSFQYPGAEKPVLQDVSLTINKGEFLAVIGRNGSGKSTLCKLLNGLIPHFYVGDFFGKVTVNNLVTTEHKVADLSRHVGYVYQDFDNQIVCPRVLEDASFAPLNYGDPDYKNKGKQALQLVELLGFDDEFIWELSGGQKHLLALAGALSLDPDILIIDEPVAQLDPYHAKKMYDILYNLNVKHGKTIIVIEHHTEFIADYCRQVVLMDSGSVVWKQATTDALRQVEQLTARQIYPPQVAQAAYLLGESAADRLPVTLEQAAALFPKITDTASAVRKEKTVSQQPHANKKAVAELKQVVFSYKTIARERKTVLQNINLTVHQGDYIALVGNNGSGKSSLLRLLTGLVKPDKGDVLVTGKNTRRQPPEQLADEVTYIYQNPEEMFIEDCVRKDVEYFLKARKIPDYSKKVDRILAMFDLTELQHHDSRLMSGGQQRRASLAIGVAMDPSILLLDEPTANLDIATRKYITRLIATLKNQTGAVIIATHDMQLVAEWATRVIVLHEGEIIHDGDRESVFSNTELLETAGLKPPQILQLSRDLQMSPLAYTVNDFVTAWKRKENLCGVCT